MRYSWLNDMPDVYKAKLYEIERLIGQPVVCGPRPHGDAAIDAIPGSLWCCDFGLEHGCAYVRIYWPSGGERNVYVMCHEIEHVYRAFVLQAPKLVLANGNSGVLSVMIDNDADHLMMLPDEFRVFEQSRVYWVNETIRAIEEACLWTDQIGKRNNLVKNYALAALLLPNSSAYEAARDACHPWIEDAEMLTNGLRSAIPDKKRICRVFVEGLQLHGSRFGWHTYKVSEGHISYQRFGR